MCVVLSGAGAQARVFKSYDDVLKNGTKAEIAAMTAALEQVGHGENKLLRDGPPSVFVWTQIPPPGTTRYAPFGSGCTVEAGGYPSGGTFAWSYRAGEQDPWHSLPGDGSDTTFPGDEMGTFTVHVVYTLDGEEPDAYGTVVVYAGDLDVDGIDNGGPEYYAEPEQDPEVNPGVLVGLNGARRKITLTVAPSEGFCEQEPEDGHFWSAGLGTSGTGQVQFWTAEQGGQQVTELSWYGHEEGGPWTSSMPPSELWVQGTGSGEVEVTLTSCVDDHLVQPQNVCTDTVKFSVMEARLDADGVDDGDEEDPGPRLQGRIPYPPHPQALPGGRGRRRR